MDKSKKLLRPVIVSFVILVSFTNIVYPYCPTFCVCSTNVDTNSTVTIDCSDIGLEDIPLFRIPENATRLLLARNKITNLGNIRDVKMMNLQVLDLRGNPLKTIPNHVFKQLPNLTTLYIDAESVESNAFDGLKLEFLSLSGIHHDTVSLQLFSSFTSLKEFNITETHIKHLPDNFLAPFTSLLLLDLSRNDLIDIPAISFGHQTLKKLVLKNNRIERFGLCNSFNSLTHLDVSSNNLFSLQTNFSDCFPHLEVFNTSFNRLCHLPILSSASHLISLDVQHNALATLLGGLLSNVSGSLVKLNLGHNPWKKVNTSELRLFQNLRELRLQNMSLINLDLSPIELWDEKKKMRGLDVLDLSYNPGLKSYRIPEQTTINNLLLAHNNLNGFPIFSREHGRILHCDVTWNNIRSLVIMRSLSILNASHNMIDSLLIPDGWTEVDVLDLSHNNISSIDKIYIGSKTFLKNVNFSFNAIKHIKPFYQVPPEISGRHSYKLRPLKIDFSFNRILSISESSFFGMPPLVSLKLNNNRLKTLPPNIFENQTRLVTLNLNENMISTTIFSSKTFMRSAFRYVAYLRLAFNNIANVSELNINRLKYLQSLDLSNNPFPFLPNAFLTANKRLKRIIIFNTSLECTCNVTKKIGNAMTVKRRFSLKVEGNCLDNSAKNKRNLTEVISLTESCRVMKCVLLEQCSIDQRSLNFNCSCLRQVVNVTAEYTLPLFGKPSSNETCWNRELVFCKEPLCKNNTMIKLHLDVLSNTTTNNGYCTLNVGVSPRIKWNGNIIQCPGTPVLFNQFCELNPNFKASSKHAGLIGGIIVGAVFVIVVASIVVHKVKSQNAPAESCLDLHALADLDYLENNHVKSNL